MYNFLFSPSKGMMKVVTKFKLAKEKKDETIKYCLMPKIPEENSINGGKVELTKIDSPVTKENKTFFLIQALIIPILMMSVSFLLGAKNIFHFSPIAQALVATSFLITISYALYSLNQIKHFEYGVKEATKHDIKVLAIAVLYFIGGGYLSITSDIISYPGISSLILNGIWFMMFIELFKKPALIILSKRVQYWEYSDQSGDFDYILITSKKKDVEI